MAVVSLHLGQAGVQLGDACWSQYCREHGIDGKGKLELRDNPSTTTIRSSQEVSSMTLRSRQAYEFGDCHEYDPSCIDLDGFQSFFQEMPNGCHSPKAIFVDLEPSVIDELRNGKNKDLYSPGSLAKGTEDAANNYARGYCTVGKTMMAKVDDTVSSMVEMSDKLQGFMVMNSTGGGTGSGFHALLTSHLNDEYPKCTMLGVEIFPSPKLSTAVVEPYNTVLNKNATMNLMDCVFLADNEAMYNICQNKLGIDNPQYLNLNRLLATTVSSMTASLRFKGSLNADFADFQTNLVPYPRVHFPIISYAPIVTSSKVSHESLSISDLTLQVFTPQSRLITCATEGRYIACCLLYRGDVTPKDVNSAIAQVKQKKSVQFVDWSPTGFKVGINNKIADPCPESEMAGPQKTVCMLANTTATYGCWESLNSKFNMMLKKRAFIHWFIGEGLQEEEFNEAQNNILTLERDYQNLG